jgi:hypothetical protein
MKLREKLKDIKESFIEQIEQSKAILKTQWNIGAEKGKEMKKAHQEKINQMRKKNE